LTGAVRIVSGADKKQITRPSNERQHALIHSSKKASKEYASANRLHYHPFTNSDARKFSCEICIRVFVRKSHLIMHRVVHNGERPHACEQCDHKFAQASALRMHVQRIHTNKHRHLKRTRRRRFTKVSSVQKKRHSLTGEFVCYFNCYSIYYDLYKYKIKG